MPIDFRIRQRTEKPDRKVVEIVIDNKVVGVIYPDFMVKGIKIVSARFSETEIPPDFEGEVIEDDGSIGFPPISSIQIRFKPRQYFIRRGRVIYLE